MPSWRKQLLRIYGVFPFLIRAKKSPLDAPGGTHTGQTLTAKWLSLFSGIQKGRREGEGGGSVGAAASSSSGCCVRMLGAHPNNGGLGELVQGGGGGGVARSPSTPPNRSLACTENIQWHLTVALMRAICSTLSVVGPGRPKWPPPPPPPPIARHPQLPPLRHFPPHSKGKSHYAPPPPPSLATSPPTSLFFSAFDA